MYRDSLDYAQNCFSNVLESCTVLTPAEVMEVLGIEKIVSTNSMNLVSFQPSLSKNAPALFPHESAGAFFSYLVMNPSGKSLCLAPSSAGNAHCTEILRAFPACGNRTK